MEAHRSYERFEQGQQLANGGEGHVGPHYGRNAALVVAVATFLSNEAVNMSLGTTRAYSLQQACLKSCGPDRGTNPSAV